MKRKLLMVMLSIVCGVCLAIGLSACGGGSDDETSDWQNGVYTIQSAYAEAQEYGYSGTLEEFIASISGADGTNGQDGTDGQDGKDGIGIADIYLNTDGELVITLTDNSSVNLGKIQSGCTHTYGDWVVGEEATCTSMGYKYRTCTECGYKDYEFTEALGHTYSTEAINCENYAHMFYCTTCNQVITEVHTFDENYYCETCGCHYYSEGLEFTLSNNQFSVSIGTCTDNNIVIPSVYKGLPVTKIDSSAFYDCTTLKSIVIPDSVTEIGELAFSGCTALTSLTIPDSVTKIGESAFSGCTALTSITIPDSVKSIGSWAFYSCTALTNIVIPNSVTVIEDCTFLWCSSLTSITIGSGITSINDDAFAYCYKLVEVNNLSSLTITAGDDDNGGVGYYAKNIYSSASDESHLITSGDYLFVYDSENNYYLVAYTGSDTALTLPTLTDKNGNIVNYSINQYAFFENTKLTSVTIPYGVTSIGNYAFEECSSLTSVYYNGTASQWASCSFSNAYSNPLYYAGNLYLNGILATDITLESITSINTYAFYNCNSLINITIPSSLTSIGSSAFCGCTALKAITIGDSVTSIGSRAFYGCASLTSAYYNGTASQWASISFSDAYANPLYYAGNLYLDGTLATDITLESITTINDYAFYNCTSLINITISSNLISVGSNAFYGCSSLENLVLYKIIFYCIDYRTFSNSFGECSSLTNIYFYGTYEEWDNILNAYTIYTGYTYEDYLASATVYYYSETQPTEEGNYWHYLNGEVAVLTVEE